MHNIGFNFVFFQAQPSHDDRLEKIVRPFQIEHTQEEMNGHEHHGPMPEDSRFLHLLFGQAAECVHDEGIDKHTDDYPRQIKELRD